jgi:hypothetical protein
VKDYIFLFVTLGCIYDVKGWVQITRSGFQVADDLRIQQNLSIEVKMLYVFCFKMLKAWSMIDATTTLAGRYPCWWSCVFLSKSLDFIR